MRMVLRAVAPLLLVLAAPVAADGSNQGISPIEKVVQMMNDMMAKSKAEKQDETVRFAQFKMFCEMTAKEKTKSIKEATEEVEQLKASIQENEALAAKLADEIGVANDNTATAAAELKKETAIRKEGNAAFKATEKDYTESIDSVERAVKTIKEGNSASLVETSLLELSSKSAVPEKSRRLIMSFLQRDPLDPEQALLQDETEFQEADPAVKAYSSSSGGVLDMVKGLGDKFESELEEAEKRETNMQHNFKMMERDLLGQIKDNKKEAADKTASKTSKEQAKGSAEGDLADTTQTLAEDKKFLADLNSECETKSIDYEKRQEVRAGEIEALGKAIEIMTSDAVSLLQVGSTVSREGAALAMLRSSSRSTAQGLVASFLEDRASASGSKVLSLIASRAADEPFKKVTKMIRDMIQKLMEEANEEAEHKGFCDTEMGTNKLTRDAKTEAAAKLKAESDELTADLAKIAEEITSLTNAIAESDAAVAKATAEREEEKAKNQATIADAKTAQEATGKALGVLKDFYAKAANPQPVPEAPKGPIKYDTRALAILKGGGALVQVPGAPEMEEGAYTGSESGGVVGMLEVIESDFARVVSETSSSEADSQRAYEEFLNDSAQDKAVKETDIKHKNEATAEKSTELAETKKDLRATQTELAAAMDYFEKLKPSCVDAGVSYEERVARRKEEIESLQEALKILSS